MPFLYLLLFPISSSLFPPSSLFYRNKLEDKFRSALTTREKTYLLYSEVCTCIQQEIMLRTRFKRFFTLRICHQGRRAWSALGFARTRAIRASDAEEARDCRSTVRKLAAGSFRRMRTNSNGDGKDELGRARIFFHFAN